MILGNFIFNYVVNRVLAENHPTKDYDRCINRRQVTLDLEVKKRILRNV